MKNGDRDFDVERAKLNVSVQSARDLVASWIEDLDDSDQDDSISNDAYKGTSLAGLGYSQPQPARVESAAMRQLKRTHDRKNLDTRSKSLPKAQTSSEDEGESRTSLKRKSRKRQLPSRHLPKKR